MSRQIHRQLPQDCNKKNGRCSVCLATHQLHLGYGLVHLHRSRNNLCFMSNKPPLPISKPQLTPFPDDFLHVHQHVQCEASIQINLIILCCKAL